MMSMLGRCSGFKGLERTFVVLSCCEVSAAMGTTRSIPEAKSDSL